MRSSCYVVGELWEENVLRNCLEYCESLHKFVCSPESGCTHSKCCTQIIEWGRLRTPTFCKHQRSLPSQQHVGVVDSAECINLAGPQWTSARRPFINIKRPFLFRLIFPNTQDIVEWLVANRHCKVVEVVDANSQRTVCFEVERLPMYKRLLQNLY
eukprot:GHVS01035526.1.p1 GENE.GHVS01035526.1~~GHVS01035526.1.p1  ORF type:complete len:156 (+),score=10.82 GHVS01035526.1:70-537(+)